MLRFLGPNLDGICAVGLQQYKVAIIMEEIAKGDRHKWARSSSNGSEKIPSSGKRCNQISRERENMIRVSRR